MEKDTFQLLNWLRSRCSKCIPEQETDSLITVIQVDGFRQPCLCNSKMQLKRHAWVLRYHETYESVKSRSGALTSTNSAVPSKSCLLIYFSWQNPNCKGGKGKSSAVQPGLCMQEVPGSSLAFPAKGFQNVRAGKFLVAAGSLATCCLSQQMGQSCDSLQSLCSVWLTCTSIITLCH